MSSIESDSWQPSRDCILWLTAATTLVVLPQLVRVPVWVSLCYVGLAGLRVTNELGLVRRPGPLLRGLVTAAAPIGVFLTYGTLLGRDAGVAMLIALAGLKLLETEKLRDAYVVVSLSAFLVITSFLFSQNIASGAYMVLVVAAILTALVAINDRAGSIPNRARLRLAGTLMLQAVPLAAVLFILFPRLPGPLWSLPKDAHAGVSRLSDSMSIGNISDLSLSNAIAFRVKFEGDLPPPRERYWRGPVLWNNDGRAWTALEPRRTSPTEVSHRGDGVAYTVTLEPHFERWLFALDLPSEIPAGARLTPDLQVLARRPVQSLRQYRMRSHPEYTMRGLSPEERAAALAIPGRFHPRTRALGRSWRQAAEREGGGTALADRRIVSQGLAYFREQPFHYTLRPPLIEGDSVDEFMFLTRRGFCEFFAAAYTVAMRAAGIPARVVTGYQGGERNEIGDYLIVRQRDAHAWVEVWLEDAGWMRIDPTAAVAPDRIERGVDASFPPTLGPAAFGLASSRALERWMRRARHSWDAIDNAWNQWVIDYGAGRQRRLLERVGLDVRDWRKVGLWLLAAAGLCLGGVACWLLRRAPDRDAARAAYRRFCAKLARRGLKRRADEGPSDFAARVGRRRPDLAAEVESITSAYLMLRYAASPGEPERGLGDLRAAISRFSP